MSHSILTDINLYNCAPSGQIAANEDMFNGDPSTDVLSMENYDEIVFFITKNAGAVGTATITVESCDDVTPTTSTAVAYNYVATTSGNTISAVTAAAAAGFTTTAGADQSYAISIRADGLSGTNKYVRMVMTEVANAAVDGAVISLGAKAAYPQAQPREMIT